MAQHTKLLTIKLLSGDVEYIKLYQQWLITSRKLLEKSQVDISREVFTSANSIQAYENCVNLVTQEYLDYLTTELSKTLRDRTWKKVEELNERYR